MTLFKKGDELRCIRPRESALTMGMIYTAVGDQRGEYIRTTCNFSSCPSFYADRFELVDKFSAIEEPSLDLYDDLL